ncbi:MAG: hypothetical protein JSS04_19155 [Proteobacteria bacterium]|nr:hypothetical protein [Pseudomonadota bacterium]
MAGFDELISTLEWFAPILMGAAWLASSLLIADVARQKGRSFVGFLLVSLVLSPLFAILLLDATPDLAREKRDHNALQSSIGPLYQQLDAIRSGASRLQVPVEPRIPSTATPARETGGGLSASTTARTT